MVRLARDREITRRALLRAAAYLAGVVCFAPAVDAQIARGRVVDALSGAPLGGGFVVLVTETGEEVRRVLSTLDGQFSVRAPSAGTYYLRSERIGYEPASSGPVNLVPGAAVEVTLETVPLAVPLEAIEVRGTRQCRTPAESGPAIAAVWEEARKALVATAWAREQRLHRYDVRTFERILDASRRRVVSEYVDSLSGYSPDPFRTPRVSALVTAGFVEVTSDGEYVLYAPDANIVLSEAFLETHCFGLKRDPERAGLIGLTFEPMSERDVADVAGVLWVVESSSELDGLEYSYTQLPFGVRDDRIGGNLSFVRLPSGAWIVNNWEIRGPIVEVQSTNTPGGVRHSVAVKGFRDTGGQVVQVRTRTGEIIYRRPGRF